MLCDTCAYASKALQDVGHMLAVNGSLDVTCNYTDFRPTVKIILGALYSEESIALARLLNVYMVPLVRIYYMFSFVIADSTAVKFHEVSLMPSFLFYLI